MDIIIKILKNTPRNGIIQRFHLMNYPYGTGFISRHVDPSTIVKATAGIYITEYWKDYDKGGFYVLNKKKKKVVIDKYVRSSDMVLFYSSMPHGVDSIYKKNHKTKSNIDGGRWFKYDACFHPITLKIDLQVKVTRIIF